MSDRQDISSKIDRMAEIKRQQESLKSEYSQLENFILKLCNEDLRDTKLKSVVYSGNRGVVTATIAESLKVVYPTHLKTIFGDAYKDAVTEETKYKVSASATRMLAGLWTEQFTRMTVSEVIAQLPCDDSTKQTIAKKVKGVNYARDRDNLISIAGFDEESAGQYAWFVAEAAVWEGFMRLLKMSGKANPDFIKEALDMIQGAVLVEETSKIALELIS